jgi:N-methylhydantoinase B
VDTLDPILLSVLKGRLEEICDEMDATLFRIAFSPVIADARDASHGIYDGRTGDMLVQGKMAHPVFVGSMSFSVKAVIERFGATFAEGDMYILNDPYLGGTHLNDVKLVRPLFVDGELVCCIASAGHWIDVGGAIPGNLNPIATDSFQEGSLIPPVRIVERGVMRDDIVDFVIAQSRVPVGARGDMTGQINALDLGARRLGELVADYGLATLRATFEELPRRASQMTRSLIAELPDGVYSFEDHVDNDGITDAPLTIALDVTIRDDRMTLDYSRSSPACPGPMNISLPATVTGTYIAIKHVFPEVPANGGCLGAIDIVVPEGSFLHAKSPRPVSGVNETMMRVIDTVFGALAQACPQRVTGAPFGTVNTLTMGGRRSDGRPFVFLTFFGGGHGGSAYGDGLNNGSASHGSATIPPAETLEATFPVLFTHWGLRVDSAGTGQHRGGLGTVHELELLADEALLTVFGDRARFGPPGIAGGGPGAANVVRYGDPDAMTVVPLGAKLAAAPFRKGQRVRFETPGGGGFGDPAARDPALVARDVRLGYLSAGAAERDYGAKR